MLIFTIHAAMVPHVILYFLFFSCYGALGAMFTFVNDCHFTVWPGIYGTPGFNSTGFELIQNNLHFVHVTESWEGAIWGRTGCTFNGLGQGSCATGDCSSGEIACYGRKATPPVTLATFNLTEIEDMDSYDVSLIEGYNLQMTVEATGRSGPCHKAGCVDDMNQWCPTELRLEGGEGCKTACQAFPSPEYCCDSSFSGRKCTSTAYDLLFKSASPRSSSSTFDNWGDREPMFRCEDADYTVRFCPPADTFSTIKHGFKLNSTDQLVSERGNFVLGFFGTDKRYLGIWHTNDVQSRKVWVANPKTPIVSTSGTHTLSIDPNTGNLIITAGGRTLMSITDVLTDPNPNVTATLEEDGNFQLINEIDKKVLWQSFDHPSNVLLPGMKLGYDITTGQNRTLTSWLSNDNPDSGAFALSWEGEFPRLMIRRQGQPYWSRLPGDNNFPSNLEFFIPYDLTTASNNLSTYTVYVDSDVALPMLVLAPNGKIIEGDNSTLLTPEFCYGNYSNNGCERWLGLPQCRSESDNFSKKDGDFARDMTISVTDDNSSLSIIDCFAKCWNDCECVGFSSNTANGTGCVIWTGRSIFFAAPTGDSILKYVISQNPNTPSTGNKTEKSKKQWIWILIGVAVPLDFLCLGLFWYIKKRKYRQEEYERRKRDEYILELTASESFKDVHQLESNGGNGNDLLIFSFASIMAATSDFSVENKLGQGGFGPVYKGKLSDGREIAIKRLSRTSGQGHLEFKNELTLIAKLQHTNLVRVLGCCIHREEKMLIYEYMPNKSLDFYLFDENKKSELDWPKRFNIIEGIAQGLLYLHKYSRMRVIHRDLKASNILLDESMNPKISDFGMARIFTQNEAEAMTNRVAGTYGYMSPEYAMQGTFSIKSDIYSFGVLIMEIITGRKNSGFVHNDRTFNLIGYAWELWQQANVLELEDPTLGSTCVLQQFMRTVHVALLCVQESAADRPTTSDMISMLLNDTIQLPVPHKPAFFTGGVKSNLTADEKKPKECSINNMTMTVMDGR